MVKILTVYIQISTVLYVHMHIQVNMWHIYPSYSHDISQLINQISAVTQERNICYYQIQMNKELEMNYYYYHHHHPHPHHHHTDHHDHHDHHHYHLCISLSACCCCLNLCQRHTMRRRIHNFLTTHSTYPLLVSTVITVVHLQLYLALTDLTCVVLRDPL